MFYVPTTTEKPDIENLKLSELTVAQFRQVFRECLDAPRKEREQQEIQRRQIYGITEPGKPVW